MDTQNELTRICGAWLLRNGRFPDSAGRPRYDTLARLRLRSKASETKPVRTMPNASVPVVSDSERQRYSTELRDTTLGIRSTARSAFQGLHRINMQLTGHRTTGRTLLLIVGTAMILALALLIWARKHQQYTPARPPIAPGTITSTLSYVHPHAPTTAIIPHSAHA